MWMQNFFLRHPVFSVKLKPGKSLLNLFEFSASENFLIPWMRNPQVCSRKKKIKKKKTTAANFAMPEPTILQYSSFLRAFHSCILQHATQTGKHCFLTGNRRHTQMQHPKLQVGLQARCHPSDYTQTSGISVSY